MTTHKPHDGANESPAEEAAGSNQAGGKDVSETEDGEFLMSVSWFLHRVAMALHREAARLNFDWRELEARYPGADALIPAGVLHPDPEWVDIEMRPGETTEEKADRRTQMMPGYRKKAI
jgi:hypothetical protein